MRIEELVSTEQQLVMHCADVKSQLTLLLEAKGISALETRVVKQLSFQASVLSVVQVTAAASKHCALARAPIVTPLADAVIALLLRLPRVSFAALERHTEVPSLTSCSRGCTP